MPTKGLPLHLGLNRVDLAHDDGWDGVWSACKFDANDMTARTLLATQATPSSIIGARQQPFTFTL